MDFIIKECEHCGKEIEIKLNSKGDVPKHLQKRRFCGVECQRNWQRAIKWEDRVGKETADRIRLETSFRVSGDKNPTKNKTTAEKVSKSLKKYLKENPRNGDKNPFYGKTHTTEFRKKHKEDKQGKRSYDDSGYKKLLENTPKGENHPNWKGGLSEYPSEFNKKLKRTIKERDNNICNICGKRTQKIAIHHIDYDKTNCNEKNLISLCYSCHGRTNFNRNNWKNFLNEKINEKYNKN